MVVCMCNALKIHDTSCHFNHALFVCFCTVRTTMSISEGTLLAVLAVCLKKKESENKVKQKKIWMKERHKKRHEFTHQNLLDELKVSSTNDFRNCLRMDSSTYEELLGMVGPLIKKKDTNMRDAIPASLRFSTTLRFLATGSHFEDIKTSSEISSCAVSKIVFETCEAIISCLKEYMQVPKTHEEWDAVAHEFYTKWNFPNCLGAVDAKHIAIKKPSGSGSLYYNYRKFFSVVLLAVVDANYEFLVADVGIDGRNSDEEVFGQSSFGKEFCDNSLDIPDPNFLPCGERILPYVFVGGDAFQLTENFMKPFAQPGPTNEQKIFNYRLNRASQVADNAFGILSSRFGVFQGPINLAPEKVQIIVLACCSLHNFLLRKTQDHILNGLVDIEDVKSGIFEKGSWRDDSELTPLQITLARNSSGSAQYVRDNFMAFFNNEGQVPWQNRVTM